MITRTTYRRPLPGSPPFFFHPPSPAPNKDKTVQRSGLSLPCVVQMQNTCPINTRSSRFRACIFPLYQTLYLAFIPVLLRHTPGTSSGTFPTRFPSSKLEAGQGGSTLGTCLVLPAVPPSPGWRHKAVKRILFAAWVYIPVSVFPGHRDRVGDSEQGRRTECGAHPKLAT